MKTQQDIQKRINECYKELREKGEPSKELYETVTDLLRRISSTIRPKDLQNLYINPEHSITGINIHFKKRSRYETLCKAFINNQGDVELKWEWGKDGFSNQQDFIARERFDASRTAQLFLKQV